MTKKKTGQETQISGALSVSTINVGVEDTLKQLSRSRLGLRVSIKSNRDHNPYKRIAGREKK